MSADEGGETEEQTCTEISAEKGIVASAQHRGILVHESGKCGEASAESGDEDEP